MSEREIYTDSKGQQWVEDPNGTRVDWMRQDGTWIRGRLEPVDAYRAMVHNTLTPHPIGSWPDSVGARVVRLTEVATDHDIMDRSVLDEAAATAADFCGHTSVNHREALARVIRAATGRELSPRVLDRLIEAGARAYWVEVPR